jgi:seryl-tRNA synthetase
MTLDIDLFRVDKGGDPEKMRANQKARFKDVGLVETVVAEDTKWRTLRHTGDALNRLKNVLSKAIGERMKKKEEVGESQVGPQVPPLDKLVADDLKALSLGQLKTLRADLDKAMEANAAELLESEKKRKEALWELGNILHPSVPVDDNEDNNRVERTWGDIKSTKKYSHVDLIVVSSPSSCGI